MPRAVKRNNFMKPMKRIMDRKKCFQEDKLFFRSERKQKRSLAPRLPLLYHI